MKKNSSKQSLCCFLFLCLGSCISLEAQASSHGDFIPTIPELLDPDNKHHGLNLEKVQLRSHYYNRKTDFNDVSVRITNLQRQKLFYQDLIKQRKNLELSIKFCGKALGSPRDSPRESEEITQLRQGLRDKIVAVDAMMAYSKRFQDGAAQDIMDTLGLSLKQIRRIPAEDDEY